MHIVEFKGGLGNQLFELCLYYKLIEKYGERNVFSYTKYYDSYDPHEGLVVDKFIKLNTINNLPKQCKNIDEENYFKTNYKNEENYYYIGYWQSERYFPKDMSFFNKIFNVHALDKTALRILNSIKSTDKSVSIHVRRGDYVNHYLYDGVVNTHYYNNCIDYVLKKQPGSKFYLFSNDIQWCRDNFNFRSDVVYVPLHKSWMDIYLMSKCKINITSNSTFSWWAKTINANKDKIVLTPKYWYNVPYNVELLDFNESIPIDNFRRYHSPITNSEITFVLLIRNEEFEIVRGTVMSVMNQVNPNISIVIYINEKDKNINYLKDLSKKDKRIIIVIKKFLFKYPKINVKLIRGGLVVVTPTYFLKDHFCSFLKQNKNLHLMIDDDLFIKIEGKKIKNKLYNKYFNKKLLPNRKALSIKALHKCFKCI